jgi:hypothetical protein
VDNRRVDLWLPLAACAKEHGCASENNVVGLIVIVVLVLGVAGGVAGWAWFRWERGPFPVLMRVFGLRLRKDK